MQEILKAQIGKTCRVETPDRVYIGRLKFANQMFSVAGLIFEPEEIESVAEIEGYVTIEITNPDSKMTEATAEIERLAILAGHGDDSAMDRWLDWLSREPRGKRSSINAACAALAHAAH